MTALVGPTEVACPLACVVPEGLTLTPVPAPRHDWADVMVCPNTIQGEAPCGRAFLVGEV